MTDWQPTASIEVIKQRADMYQKIRAFFAERGVLAFESPLLCHFGVTDIHTDNIRVGNLFLQSSPEYAMKRAIAAYQHSIFQICKAFRQDEAGKKHRPEFTLLEWYRIGFDHHQLMDEVDTLLMGLLNTEHAVRYSYQAIFKHCINLDPLHCSQAECLEALKKHGVTLSERAGMMDKDAALSLLMAEVIEPQLGDETLRPVFIYDYPHTQAALAKIDPNNPLVAQRFEVYVKGIELANGFNELTDAKQQQSRFKQDQQQRQQQQLPAVAIDHQLISALQHGLPNCAGVALGLDRLLMLISRKNDIRDVISFDSWL